MLHKGGFFDFSAEKSDQSKKTKTIDKYTRAMEYAEAKKMKSDDFAEQINGSGMSLTAMATKGRLLTKVENKKRHKKLTNNVPLSEMDEELLVSHNGKRLHGGEYQVWIVRNDKEAKAGKRSMNSP